jgi:hypothetical protein
MFLLPAGCSLDGKAVAERPLILGATNTSKSKVTMRAVDLLRLPIHKGGLKEVLDKKGFNLKLVKEMTKPTATSATPDANAASEGSLAQARVAPMQVGGAEASAVLRPAAGPRRQTVRASSSRGQTGRPSAANSLSQNAGDVAPPAHAAPQGTDDIAAANRIPSAASPRLPASGLASGAIAPPAQAAAQGTDDNAAAIPIPLAASPSLPASGLASGVDPSPSEAASVRKVVKERVVERICAPSGPAEY